MQFRKSGPMIQRPFKRFFEKKTSIILSTWWEFFHLLHQRVETFIAVPSKETSCTSNALYCHHFQWTLRSNIQTCLYEFSKHWGSTQLGPRIPQINICNYNAIIAPRYQNETVTVGWPDVDDANCLHFRTRCVKKYHNTADPQYVIYT